MPRLIALALTLITVACATATTPNQTSVWGHVRLVRHADLRDASSAGDAYGDRRLRGVELVDYSRPGFSVVYLETPRAVMDVARVEHALPLTIRSRGIRARFEPTRLAIRAGDSIHLRNRDRESHVVSCPEASILRQIDPGQEVHLKLRDPGDYRCYLADVPGADSIVFVAPGPFAVTSSSGRFLITDLSPGSWTLHAWHPRFPPTSRDVVITAGDSLRIDFEIGVGQKQESQ